MATYSKGRGKGRKAATDNLVGVEIPKQPDTRLSIRRLLAGKVGVSRMTIQRVIKHVLRRPTFKRVKTCANAASPRGKRAKAEGRISRGVAAGKCNLKTTFWTDESWLDATGNRRNPQNWRVIGLPGQGKSIPEPQNALAIPQQQRGRGVMAHMAVSAFDDGAVLQPHFVPVGGHIDSEYYSRNIPQNDVLPMIRAAIMGAWGRRRR